MSHDSHGHDHDHSAEPGEATASASGRPAPLGGLVGGASGGLGGAIAGFFVGGPVGAVVGGALGALSGAPLGDIATAERRALTAREREAARMVFGESLDLDRVVLAGAPILGIGRIARALPHAVFFPLADFRKGPSLRWVIHELTHAWQYQHGVSLATTLFHALRRKYAYGEAKGLRAALAADKRFTDFNTEQQGEILADYFTRSRKGEDVSAWQPFVAQVRATPRRR
ncbi:MAG TPA: hypothetical protein VEW03_05110 [Longimicrobiaceae bacterium]|nr:hypothetical protein [Longimicrobiaceae bacterium]